jgi:hypothetical protein
MLLLSILYRLLRCLLGLTAVLVRRDVSKDAELLVLRQENTVLRLWVPNWSSVSCDLGIFVDQPAESVATLEAKVGL